MKFKNNNGFTLVELMVVVAIIGLLSSVAIPNFKKYQAKAKVAEAKLQLASIYTAESGFFSDYNMYDSCLTYMGYDPGPESASRYYATGFTVQDPMDPAALASAVNSGLNTSLGECDQSLTIGGMGSTSANGSSLFYPEKSIGSYVANDETFLPVENNVGSQDSSSTMFFIAGAGGIISEDFTTGANCSKLTIDHNKVMSSKSNGF